MLLLWRKQWQDALDTTFDISKLLKYSSKRNAAYLKIKEEISPNEAGFRTLYPTRWTVRAESLASVNRNYSVLQSSLNCFSEMASRDLEMSSRVNGIAAQLEKFDFLFADKLSRSLQQKKLSAAEGHRAAMLTCDTLSALRSESEFSKFLGN